MLNPFNRISDVWDVIRFVVIVVSLAALLVFWIAKGHLSAAASLIGLIGTPLAGAIVAGRTHKKWLKIAAPVVAIATVPVWIYLVIVTDPSNKAPRSPAPSRSAK